MKFPRWAPLLIGVMGGAMLATMSGGSGRTPYSMAQIRAALSAAWPSVVGGDAPDGALRILGAQIALETANGSAVMGNNLGNFKASKGDKLTTTFQTTEVVNGQTISLPQTFKAWPDLASGAVAYLQAMTGRFGSAWQYVLSGDTAGFAQALKDERYYTADEGAYARGLVARGAPPLGQVAAPAQDDSGNDPTGDMSNQDDTASAATSAGESDDS